MENEECNHSSFIKVLFIWYSVRLTTLNYNFNDKTCVIVVVFLCCYCCVFFSFRWSLKWLVGDVSCCRYDPMDYICYPMISIYLLIVVILILKFNSNKNDAFLLLTSSSTMKKKCISVCINSKRHIFFNFQRKWDSKNDK